MKVIPKLSIHFIVSHTSNFVFQTTVLSNLPGHIGHVNGARQAMFWLAEPSIDKWGVCSHFRQADIFRK